MRLSHYVHRNPEVIDSSLQRLSCVSQNITEVDVAVTFLTFLLKSPLPSSVRRDVVELLQRDEVSVINRGGTGERRSKGLNPAIALSLHAIHLSRNRITNTIGLAQFKNVVRLSLLGNRIQRIEDCEGLSLLPALRVLSLEFNPVTLLPHYRAHMLRICSWPDSIQPKNCRLQKLDSRSILPLEVERAAQCLQREKVTLGELVQRMRFLAFLIEAKKRIDVHHELRRRGVVVQDITTGLTVENVVTRCSAQLLTFVDVGAASHFARRLMGGRCRMCDITMKDADGAADSICGPESVILAESPNHSRDAVNMLTLQHPQQAVLSAFCKDWSGDVFRRATAALDHRICGLLLDIAHSLGEELSVVDVDYLNKLWFTQVAKVDNWNLRQQQRNDGSKMTTEGVPQAQSCSPVRSPVTPEGNRKSCAQKKSIEIILTPNEVCSPVGHANGNIEGSDVTISCISPIPQRNEDTELSCMSRGNVERTRIPVPNNGSSFIQSDPKVNGTTDGLLEKQVTFCQEEGCSELLSLTHVASPRHRAPMENGVITTEDIILSERYAKKRVFQKWWLRTKNRRNNALCVEFLRKRLNDLIATTCPTSQSICATLGLLPRSERKRVLFRFWYDQACSLYMPRSFRLGTLLMRWRYRTYKLCSAKFAEAHYRSMTKRKVWSRWCKHTQLRNNAISNGLHSSPISIEKTLSAPIPQQVNGEVGLNLVPGPDLCTKETKPMTTRQTQADFTIMEGEGLHPSKKESPKGVTGGSRAPQCEGTPNVAQRLLLPMATPSPPSTVPAQHPGSAEMATQTAFSSPPSCPATPAGQTPIHVDTEVAVAALLEDRVRLVDRIIALEMKVNEEAVAVQNREREIRDLKQKLNFMVMREECIESTVKDYQQKCEHLQAVVHALRTERRETLLSTMR